MNMDCWARDETALLSGLTVSQLKQLERKAIIVPQRLYFGKKPKIWYDWSQVIALRAVARLREQCSLPALTEALSYLNVDFLDVHTHLVAFERHIYFVHKENEILSLIKTTGKNQGQFIATFSLAEIEDEILSVGKGQIIDFESRVQRAKSVA